MGLGEIILFVVFIVALCTSLSSRRLAAWTVAVGLWLGAWFALSVMLADSFPILAAPYRVINLYVFLFIAVLLTLVGGIGLLVHLIRGSHDGIQS